jgi:hypothetical protein
MTAGDAAEIRAWAHQRGRPCPERGTIPKALRDDWEREQLEAAVLIGADDPELFPPAGDDPGSEPAPPPDLSERRPRNVAAAKRSRWPLPGRGKPQAKGKGRAKAKPRVPLDDLIATLWRGAAGMLRPLPATSRLLKIQAPVAGALLEPMARGTIADTILQPLARTTEGAEAIAALAGPPILVAMMELDPAKADLCMPILRELMLRWCKLAGPKMAEAMARESEFEEQFGATVDSILSLLGEQLADQGAEDEAVRQVQDTMQAGAAA